MCLSISTKKPGTGAGFRRIVWNAQSPSFEPYRATGNGTGTSGPFTPATRAISAFSSFCVVFQFPRM